MDTHSTFTPGSSSTSLNNPTGSESPSKHLLHLKSATYPNSILDPTQESNPGRPDSNTGGRIQSHKRCPLHYHCTLHGMSGIRNSTSGAPGNIPPSTTVLCHSLLYTHSLHVSLDTTPPCFLRSTSAHHIGHNHPQAILHPIVLFLPFNMPKPSQPCSLDLVLNTFNAQTTQEIITKLPIL